VFPITAIKGKTLTNSTHFLSQCKFGVIWTIWPTIELWAFLWASFDYLFQSHK